MDTGTRHVIVDASTVLAILLPDENSREIEEVLQEYVIGNVVLCAPELLNLEVGNALLSAVKRKRITLANARSLFEQFSKLGIEIIPVDPVETFKIAVKGSITTCDAAHMFLKAKLKCDLLTLDKKLTNPQA